MPSGRDQGIHDVSNVDLSVQVKIHGDNSLEPTVLSSESILVKSGGRLARWFRLRSSLLSQVPLIPETEEAYRDDANGDERFTSTVETWDPTTASNSNPKSKKGTQVQKAKDNSKRRQSALAAGQSSSTGNAKQPRGGRRASSAGSKKLAEALEGSSETGESSKPTALQKLLHLETEEQNERIKRLRDEMAERLEQIRDIKKIQVKNKVEEKLATEISEKEKEDEKHLEELRDNLRHELEESRLKPFKDKLQNELDERMKSKETQSKSDLEGVWSKIQTDYTNQAKALMQELEKKSQKDLKPLLVEARNKVRQDVAEEEKRLEGFVNAQVTHDCQKIDEECDFRIEAVNRERKERQLAVRQRGKETIENERSRPDKVQERDEREKAAFSDIENEEKEKIQKEKESITANFAQREAADMVALEQDAAQKLVFTKNLFEEQNQKKLQDCTAEIEREVEARLRSAKIVKAGEKRKFAEHRRSLLEKEVSEDISLTLSEPAATQETQSQPAETRSDSATKQLKPDASETSGSSSTNTEQKLPAEIIPERPKLNLIEEELLLHEAMQSVSNADASAQKTVKAKGRMVGFGNDVIILEKNAKEDEEEGSSSCAFAKEGGGACLDSLFQTVKAATERPRGRSFAHPRESIYVRLKGNL